MKTILFVVMALLLATTASAQVHLQYAWTQPDSTAGTVGPAGPIGRMAIPDDWLAHYVVELSVDGEITTWGEIPAPFAIADTVIALITVPLNVDVAIRVQAVDKDNRHGGFSEWSDTFFVDPGPPLPAEKPRLIKIFLGG